MIIPSNKLQLWILSKLDYCNQTGIQERYVWPSNLKSLAHQNAQNLMATPDKHVDHNKSTKNSKQRDKRVDTYFSFIFTHGGATEACERTSRNCI